MKEPPTIHRFPTEHEGAFVNAYLVETSSGVVAVDGLLTVSASRAMRDGLERIGKPFGESITFDDVTFTVIDLGPSESPHDSPWVLGHDEKIVFLGDQIYDRRHCYLADGFYREWLANIETLRNRFPRDAVFYIGHGGPVGRAMWECQRRYIELFVDAVAGADWSRPDDARSAVINRMKEYEPSDELQFLMELSIEPVAAELGLLDQAAVRA
jgi:glyoxylase-like metal-dependent hydrolase (beta-lactamase superfamily II)